MIGQETIKSRLLISQRVSNLPNSMLFLGDCGCGKHTLANELANHYDLPLLDITKNISFESIEEIYLNPTQAFYLINMDEISERQQNALLKFIEEPLPNSFIVLLASSKNNLLETIINRCVLYEFRPYTKEELKQFISKEDIMSLDEYTIEDILSLCSTPGQVINLNIKTLVGIHALCENMILNMSKANYPNALVIAKKINYKDEYDKFDFNVFLNCYKQHLLKKYMESNSTLYIDLYNIVIKECELLKINNINKEYFMEHLITKLWERSKNEVK